MKLEKFMFCMRLETIGLVIGFLGVFICAVSLFSLIGGFSYLICALINLNFEDQHQEDDVSVLVSMITVGFIFAIMVVLAFTQMHVQLIKGIRNKQHEKIRPWLVVQSIVIAMNLLGMMTFFGGRVPFSYIASHIAGSAFQIYCFMAVHSLYENIKEYNCWQFDATYQ